MGRSVTRSETYSLPRDLTSNTDEIILSKQDLVCSLNPIKQSNPVCAYMPACMRSCVWACV